MQRRVRNLSEHLKKRDLHRKNFENIFKEIECWMNDYRLSFFIFAILNCLKVKLQINTSQSDMFY